MAAMGSPGLDNLFAKFDERVVKANKGKDALKAAFYPAKDDSESEEDVVLTGLELEMMAKRDEEKRVAAENAKKEGSNIEAREVQPGPREKIDEMEKHLAELEKYWDA
jgi:hypothetical protein